MRLTSTIAASLWLLVPATAEAATFWACEVLHVYDLGAAGLHQRDATSSIPGKRFTVRDDSGEVNGSMLGDAKEWRSVPRRYGPDQDGLQSVRSSGGRQTMHLYVETFAPDPTKPFVMSELDIGASRTGTCRAGD